MNDPLAKQENPYEILGIERSANSEDIKHAFKARVLKVKVQKLQRARLVLERPVDRALLDLFLYDPNVLDAVQPNPLTQTESLELPSRAETASAWEAIHRRAFPNAQVNRSLAVLWYWWAMYESAALLESSAEDGSTDSARVTDLWQAAIGCWAMLWADHDYWEEKSGVSPEHVAGVRVRCVEQITGNLRDYAEQHRDAGQEELGEVYVGLELDFVTETRTARTISEVNARLGLGVPACGRIQMHRFDWLEDMRESLGKGLASMPGDEHLQAIVRALSPHAGIVAQIERKQYQDALDAIQDLSGDDRATDEVLALKAEALLEFGRQQESLGHAEEALELWADAMACEPPSSLRTSISETVENTCLRLAASLGQKKRNKVIKLLVEGLKCVESQKMGDLLAEYLTARGVETVVKAQEKVEDVEDVGPEGLEDLAKALKRGLRDLNKASKLGSERAKEQAATARKILKQIEGALKSGPGVSLPSDVAKLLEDAQKEAESGNLMQAVTNLELALSKITSGSEAETFIKKNLSAAHSGLGVEQANEGELNFAEICLERAVELDPDNDHARTNLSALQDVKNRRASGGWKPSDTAALTDKLLKDFYTPKPGNRPYVHAYVSLGIFLAMIATGLLATPGPKWFLSRPATWVAEVGTRTTYGMAAVRLMWAAGLLGIVQLGFGQLRGNRTMTSAALFRRWSKKATRARLMEGLLYGTYALFAASIFLEAPPIPTVELPPDYEVAAEVVVEEAEPASGTEVAPTPASSTAETVPAEAPPAAPAAAPATEAVEIDLSGVEWMTAEVIPTEAVSAWLTGLSILDAEGVEATAALLTAGLDGASAEGLAAASLLLGWSAEVRGDAAAARDAYHRLLSFAGDSRYGHSAQLRLDLLAAEDPEAAESVYEGLYDSPDVDVWARVDGVWSTISSRRLASVGLLELRADWRSVRLLNRWYRPPWLPSHYHYLFYFVLVSLFFLTFQLPMLSENAENIRRLSRGKSPSNTGCVTQPLTIVVAVLVFLLFRGYEPQLILDQARFLWVDSVVERDLGLHFLWVCLGSYLWLITPMDRYPRATRLLQGFIFWAIIGLITWFWGWPAWAMVFWIVMWTMTAVLQLFMAAAKGMRA